MTQLQKKRKNEKIAKNIKQKMCFLTKLKKQNGNGNICVLGHNF